MEDNTRAVGLAEFADRYGHLIDSDPNPAIEAFTRRVAQFPSTGKLIVDTTPGKRGPTHPPVEWHISGEKIVAREALEVVTTMGLVKLTDWDSGEDLYLDRSHIVSMRRIPSSHSDLSGELRELGARTRIDTRTDLLLVRETPDEILDAK